MPIFDDSGGGSGSLSAIADQTFLGNVSGASAVPVALTAAQGRTLFSVLALAGGTLTGALLFSGTAHAGVALNNLTTTQQNALASPAAGMLVFNTTLVAPTVYDGSAWQQVGLLGKAQTWTGVQTFTGPALGTPASGVLTNCTGLPNASVVGLGSFALLNSLAFSSLTGIPTTLAGYGITDAIAIKGSANTFTAQNTFAAGTITTSQPFTITQTWNAGAVAFTGLLANYTNTASAATSKLLDLQVGGTSKFFVSLLGRVNSDFFGTATGASNLTGMYVAGATDLQFYINNGVILDLSSATNTVGLFNTAMLGFSATTTPDLFLVRDAANTLAQRGTAAQVTRGYFSYTDAGNYHRWALQSGADYVELAAETAGTGADNLDVRLSPAGTGNVRINQAAATVGTGTKTISNAADGSTNFGHYFAINLNGTVYYVPCGAVAPT